MVTALPNQATAPYLTCDAGALEMGRLLLDHGANIEAVDFERWTSLMCAAWRGYTSMVEMLLEKGRN